MSKLLFVPVYKVSILKEGYQECQCRSRRICSPMNDTVDMVQAPFNVGNSHRYAVGFSALEASHEGQLSKDSCGNPAVPTRMKINVLLPPQVFQLHQSCNIRC